MQKTLRDCFWGEGGGGVSSLGECSFAHDAKNTRIGMFRLCRMRKPLWGVFCRGVTLMLHRPKPKVFLSAWHFDWSRLLPSSASINRIALLIFLFASEIHKIWVRIIQDCQGLQSKYCSAETVLQRERTKRWVFELFPPFYLWLPGRSRTGVLYMQWLAGTAGLVLWSINKTNG